MKKALYLLGLLIGLSAPLWAPISNRLNIATPDGTINTFPYKASFSNGSVTDNGDGTVSITSSGGGGGSSSLETIFGTVRSSPTATILAPAPFKGSVTGSTNTLSVDYSSFTMQGPFVSSITLSAMYGAPTLTGTNFTSLPGAQVGSGVPAANIAAGSLGSLVIASSEAVSSVGVSQMNFSGTASNTTFARGDGTWSTPAGGSGANWSVAVGTGGTGGYTGTITSTQTQVILADSSTFKIVAQGGVTNATSYWQINPASGTLQGNTFNGASQLVQLNSSTQLPAISGVNLTNLNASNMASGTLPAGQFPALTGDITTSAGSLATTAAATQANIRTFTGAITHTSSTTFNSQIAVSQGLDFNGINAVSANYTVTSTDTYISCSASGGARTITLDAANALIGQHLWIDKSDTSANACTVKAAGSDTIDYTTTTFKLNAQGQGIKIVSDGGANWKAPDGLSATPPFIGYPDAPSAAQTLSANQSQLRAIYVSVPIRATGLRYNEQAQSGNLDVGLYDNSGILLAHSGTTAAPATGQNTTNFSSAINIAPGIYYLAIAVDNATISFAKSSGNGVIGCNNISTNFVLANVTLPGTLTGNCLAMVLTVSGGVAQ